MRHIVRRIADYCPETEVRQTIEVKFVEVPLLGAAAPGYKATGYYCSYADEHSCSSNGSNGADCPLFRRAISEMS